MNASEMEQRRIKQGIIGDWCWGYNGQRLPTKTQRITLEIEHSEWELLQLMSLEQCITPQAMILLGIQKMLTEWRKS